MLVNECISDDALVDTLLFLDHHWSSIAFHDVPVENLDISSWIVLNLYRQGLHLLREGLMLLRFTLDALEIFLNGAMCHSHIREQPDDMA